ncbi:hypothetical protein ACJJTC_010133, partial [Scirpophaga incertulas]
TASSSCLALRRWLFSPQRELRLARQEPLAAQYFFWQVRTHLARAVHRQLQLQLQHGVVVVPGAAALAVQPAARAAPGAPGAAGRAVLLLAGAHSPSTRCTSPTTTTTTARRRRRAWRCGAGCSARSASCAWRARSRWPRSTSSGRYALT